MDSVECLQVILFTTTPNIKLENSVILRCTGRGLGGVGWDIVARPLEECDSVGQNRRTRRVQSDTRLLDRTGNYTKDTLPHPCRLTGLCLPHSRLVLLASDGCYNRAEAGLGLAQLPHGSQKFRACGQASLFSVKCIP